MHGKGKYTWADGVEYEVSWHFVRLHLRFIYRIYILFDVLCLFSLKNDLRNSEYRYIFSYYSTLIQHGIRGAEGFGGQTLACVCN